MDKLKLFMVEFEVPADLTAGFMRKIPAHRKMVHQFLAADKIVNYTLAMDKSKLWMVVKAETVSDVEEIISELPLSPYMTPIIHPLMFHNSSFDLRLPALSLN